MKKYILFVTIFFHAFGAIAQTIPGSTCAAAQPFCTGTLVFQAATNVDAAEAGPDYGCLDTRPNPTWFYLKIGTGGDISFRITGSSDHDIDFIVYGPFSSALNHCGELTSSKIRDCGYTTTAAETANLYGTLAGEYYIVLITNYSKLPTSITFEKLSGAGETTCDILQCTANASNNGPVCSGGTLALTTPYQSGATYSWTGPNGFTSSLQSPVLNNATGAMSGAYTVVVTAGSCVSAPSTTNVTVNTVSTSASNNGPVCLGGVLSLSTPTVTGGSYLWAGPNGFSSTEQNPTITSFSAAHAGTYTVIVAQNECLSTPATTTVSVAPDLSVNPSSNSPACPGSVLQLSAPQILGATYQWTGPNGFSSSESSPTITGMDASKAGDYSLTATLGSCHSSGLTTVLFNSTPLTVTASNSGDVCSGTTTLLKASASMDGSSYSWTGPNGFSSSVQNPTVSVINTGSTAISQTYSVTAQKGACQSSTAYTTITVNPSSTILDKIGFSDISCNSVTINYSGVVEPGDMWSFGDGKTEAVGPAHATRHTYPSPGVYTVMIIKSSPANCTQISAAVTIPDFTTAGFTYKIENPCDVSSGVTLTIGNYNPDYGYMWRFDQGTQAGGMDPKTFFSPYFKNGENEVVLTVTAINGCTTQVSKKIYVGAPEPVFDVAENVCTGDVLSVSNVNSGGDTYTWSVTNTTMGTSEVLTGMTPYYVFPLAGTYTVSLKIQTTIGSVMCTRESGEHTVQVRNFPVAEFTFGTSGSGCSGSVLLDLPANTNNMTGYTLDYGDGSPLLTGGSTYTAGHETHTYVKNGVFTITLTVQNGSCVKTYSRNTLVNGKVTAALITSSDYLCPGGQVTLEGKITGIVTSPSYYWQGPDDFQSTSPLITVSKEGLYTLYINSEGSCPFNTQLQKTITLLAKLPEQTVATVVNTITCDQTTGSATIPIPLELVQQGFIVNGVLTSANPQASTGITYTVTGLVAGDNYITVASALGSQCSSSILVHMDQTTPVVNYDFPQPQNCGQTVTATATLAGSTISWYKAVDYPQTPLANGGVGLNAGTYVVEVIKGSCKITKYFDITLPVINLSLENSNLTTCAGNVIQAKIIAAPGGTYTYVWKKKNTSGQYLAITGTGNTNDLEPGDYLVEATSSNSCTNSIGFTVKQLPPIAITFKMQTGTCKNDGEVEALVSGGDGNYTYVWKKGEQVLTETADPVLDLQGVTVSTLIEVHVTDHSGCSATYSQTYNPVTPVTLASSCGAADVGGTAASPAVHIENCDISACVEGGVAPYIFEWYRIGTKTSQQERFFTLVKNTNGEVVGLKDASGASVPTPASQTEVDNNLIKNSDGIAATYQYPYWDFTDPQHIVPKLAAANTAYTIVENVADDDARFLITSNSGASGATTSNDQFEDGNYQLSVTDANGCKYDFDIGALTFEKPTGFPIDFDFVFGRTPIDEVTPEEPPTDVVLVENMIESANEMSEMASECMKKNAQRTTSALTRDCFSLSNFSDAFTISYEIKEHQYTLYYYDRAGRLTKTVPPQGVQPLTINEINQVKNNRQSSTGTPVATTHTKFTTYQYNSLNQLIRQESPDGGITRFIYDDKSRLRFSQNAKQAVLFACSYTKYDELGRIVEVGETASGNLTFSDAPTNDQVGTNLDIAKDKTFPNDGTQITHTVYSEPASGQTYYGQPQRYLQNRVSYTYLDENPLATGDEHYTYYSYDSHGNVEWMIQEDKQLGKNFIGYEYDLVSGKVLKVKYNENRSDRFFHRYSYDTENRVTAVETSRDGELWDKDASYKYYAHGPLERTTLGEDHVQGLDMVYTIQGWLKAINTPHLNAADDPGADGTALTSSWNTAAAARDKFGMILNYFRGDYTRSSSYLNNSATASGNSNINVNSLYASAGTNAPDLFNGNISSWVHSQLSMVDPGGSAPEASRVDLFKYDVLNRITQSMDLKQNGTSWTTIGNTDTYKTQYTYDRNGNIKTLLRHDEAGGEMDHLSYEYANENNQLNKVKEALGSNTADGRGDIEGEHLYTYDAIGNLQSESSQERLPDANGNYALRQVVMNIDWNVYGKIKAIYKDVDFNGVNHQEQIRFSYDASGNRTQKTVWRDAGSYDGVEAADGKETTVTYYVRDAQGNVMSVYTREFDLQSQLFQYKLIEQPIYGASRIGENKQPVIIKTAATVDELTPPSEGIQTRSEYQNWITTTNQTTLLPGNNDQLCECRIKQLAGNATTPYSNIATTAEFLGVAENGIAVAENLSGQLQFYVVFAKKYLGNKDACLVYDRNGNLMKGTEQIGKINTNSKPIVTNIAGTNKYVVVTLNNKSQPVYQVVDMDATGYGTLEKAGEVRAVNKPMVTYGKAAPKHGWHFTAYEDHINKKSIVYSSRYLLNPADSRTGTTELVAYEFGQDYTLQPQEHVLQSLNGCGNTETGELQISPKGDKLLWYQHDKNVAGFAHREATIYTLPLTSDKLGVTGNVNVSISPAGNYGKGSAEFLSNNEDLLYAQNGLYKTGTANREKNIWKYEQLSATSQAINQLTDMNNPAVTYLYGEIRRGADGNYYIPNLGDPAKEIHSFSGDVWNANVALTGDAAEQSAQLATALPTQVFKIFTNANDAVPGSSSSDFQRVLGSKVYELNDHLGNVNVVISDEKQVVNANADATINAGDYFVPTILSFADYYAFGMEMPVRVLNKGGYRYGFNGQEKDDEISGNGNSYNAEFWQYDPRLGRRWNIDPIAKPHLSSFATFSNNPILNIDPSGDNDDDYLIKSNGSVEVKRTDAKTDNFKYEDSKGNITDLGTFTKNKAGYVNITQDGISYDIRNARSIKRFMKPEAFAAFLGASMNYYMKYGLKIQVNQFSTAIGGHSDHGGNANYIDYRYTNTKGNVDEPVWSSYKIFDKTKSQFMVDELIKFGYNSTPSNIRDGKYSILTQQGEEGTTPSLLNTGYYPGHHHHVHLQNYDMSHIKVVNNFTLQTKSEYQNPLLRDAINCYRIAYLAQQSGFTEVARRYNKSGDAAYKLFMQTGGK